jgi:hypothetical protein
MEAMTNEYLRFSDNHGKSAREMRDVKSTWDYIVQLSFSHAVRIYFDTGEWYELECGKSTGLRGMNNDGRALRSVGPEDVSAPESETTGWNTACSNRAEGL